MIKVPPLKNNDEFFVYLLHLITEEFESEAVLKGGMVLKLLGSTRETLDLDYTFVPFKSKKDVLERIKFLFLNLEGIKSEISTNSKAIRVNLSKGLLRAQIEINVALDLKTEVVSTASIIGDASPFPARIIRIMSLDVALSNKLAAWNERRLIRDLYDIYYFVSIHNLKPDWNVLESRLNNIESKIPKLKKIKSMSFTQFTDALELEIKNLTQERIETELEGLVSHTEIPGLAYRIRIAVKSLILNLQARADLEA